MNLKNGNTPYLDWIVVIASRKSQLLACQFSPYTQPPEIEIEILTNEKIQRKEERGKEENIKFRALYACR